MTEKTYHMGRDNQKDLIFYCPEDKLSSCNTSLVTWLKLVQVDWRTTTVNTDWFKRQLKKHVLPMEFFD